MKGCCVGDIFKIIQERRLEAGKPPVPDFLLRNSEDEVKLILWLINEVIVQSGFSYQKNDGLKR